MLHARSLIKGIRALSIVAAFSMAISMQSTAAVEKPPTANEFFEILQTKLARTHADQDADSYLENSRRMYGFLNGSPDSTLQLAAAEAFAGNLDNALQRLEEFVGMGQSNEGALLGKQFSAVRSAQQFPRILSKMAAANQSIESSAIAFQLPKMALIPEDIDYDPATKLFFISSVLKKAILAVDIGGHSRVFATAPDDWPILALKVDARRRTLWATEVAIKGSSLASSDAWDRSAILIYDLKSGSLLHRIEGPPHTALGDMTLTADGDAILSDGENGGVYRAYGKSKRVGRLDAGQFISPQTPAILRGGTRVLIPDYVRGLGILDLRSKGVSWIPMQREHALSGIDGLSLSGTTLLAIQNGTSPERVMRFELDSALAHVESETIIERATATLGSPTHGVVVEGHFYYIANSGWNCLDEHGNLKPGMQIPQALVMRADLRR
jgi:hypothetical protein